MVSQLLGLVFFILYIFLNDIQWSAFFRTPLGFVVLLLLLLCMNLCNLYDFVINAKYLFSSYFASVGIGIKNP